MSWICIPIMTYKVLSTTLSTSSFFLSHALHNSIFWMGQERNELLLLWHHPTQLGKLDHCWCTLTSPTKETTSQKSSHLALNCATLWGETRAISNCLSLPSPMHQCSLFFFFFKDGLKLLHGKPGLLQKVSHPLVSDWGHVLQGSWTVTERS